MGNTYFSLGLRVALPGQEARDLVERAGAVPPCKLSEGGALLAGLLAVCSRVRAGAAELVFLSRPLSGEGLVVSLAGLSAPRSAYEESAGGPYRSAGLSAEALLVLRVSGEAPLALYSLLSVGAARPLGRERLRALCVALARVPGGSARAWWACVPGSRGEVLLPRAWSELDHWSE